MNEDINVDYRNARRAGEFGSDCRKLYACPMGAGLLDKFSYLVWKYSTTTIKSGMNRISNKPKKKLVIENVCLLCHMIFINWITWIFNFFLSLEFYWHSMDCYLLARTATFSSLIRYYIISNLFFVLVFVVIIESAWFRRHSLFSEREFVRPS